MTDRITKIVLRGDISDFQAKMVAAGKSVSAATDKMTSAEKQSVKFRKGLTSVGDAAGKMGLVAAAGLGAILATAANFDSAMSKVQAATHDSADEMEQLRAAAIKAGADTVFSASEAADAITAMSKAGVKTNDILQGGLNGALSLASAGELDVASAADIAATAMNQFGLAGKDIPHIADLLAAGAGKAQGEVTDMANALKFVGPVAHQMGISIEQTTGTIAELASQGIIGEQAGTSLRGMLTALTSPSKQAAKEMQTLGINLYNARGNFVGLDGVAQQLHDHLGNLDNATRDQALGQIFGNEQITAARILYAGGAKDVDKWTKAVNDQGYAAETAATKMDNLKGDLLNLQGSLETALIGAGEGSQGPLRKLVEGLTDLVNGFNKLNPAVKDAGVAMLAITAVTGGGLWFTAKTINGISNMRESLANLGPTGTKAATALRGLGRAAVALAALEAAGAIIDQLESSAAGAAPKVQALTTSLLHLDQAKFAQQFKGIGDSLARINDPGATNKFADALNNLGDKGGMAGKAVVNAFAGMVSMQDDMAIAAVQTKKVKQEFDSLDQALAGIVNSGSPAQARQAFKDLADSQHLSADQQKQLLEQLPQYKEALAGAKNQADLNAGAERRNTDATGSNTSALQDNTKQILKNIDAMRKKRQEAIAAIDKEVAYQQAIDDATKEAGKGKKTLDADTQAGRDNLTALGNLAGAWNDLNAKQKNAKGAYQESRQQLIKVAEQMGATQKQAKHYADTLLDLPPRVETKIALDKARAQNELDAFSKAFYGLNGKTAKAFVDLQQRHITGPGGKLDRAAGGNSYATGGYTGNGGKYEPAGVVHRGEFVIDAEQTLRHRSLLEAIHRRLPGYDRGGYVQQSAQRAQMTSVNVSGMSIDYDRLASAMARVRPMYGDVHVHGDGSFRREAKADAIRQSGGGVPF